MDLTSAIPASEPENKPEQHQAEELEVNRQ